MINKTSIGDTLDITDEDVVIEDDDSDEAGNSFFETRYHGIKVLVLAPHPDDEINIAGNMILNLSRARAKIFVAYTTNGDFDIEAAVRAEEAAQSLNILGVKRENIIFLGYGDTYNGKGNPHIFLAHKPSASPAGKIETYPAGDFIDYAFTKRGRHSEYTRENFLHDVRDLILDIEADVIFCVDFDKHADHRALSLIFEQAMNDILSRPDNEYKPEIYKRFAYATAFTAVQDFYNDNLLETKRPVVGEIESYDFDLIGRANYIWDERVRFPVAEDCRETLLKDNPVARAVFCHKSQHNEWNSLGIINSDEVYFERRTDNLIFSASIEATSGDPTKVKDFHIINTDDVDSSLPNFKNYLWQPDSSDIKKKLTLHWSQLQRIEQIKIYGSISEDSGIDKIEIAFDGSSKEIFSLPKSGLPLVINLPEKIFTHRIEFRIIKAHGSDFGISEIEIFSSIDKSPVIKPFIKITKDKNFIYEYFIPKDVRQLEFEIYRFHVDKPVELIVSDGLIERDGDKFIVNFDCDKLTIKAEIMGETAIFDQIKIRRVSHLYFWHLKIKQFIERLAIHLSRKLNLQYINL